MLEMKHKMWNCKDNRFQAFPVLIRHGTFAPPVGHSANEELCSIPQISEYFATQWSEFEFYSSGFSKKTRDLASITTLMHFSIHCISKIGISNKQPNATAQVMPTETPRSK